ncbi:MAG TPA: hypothetical protein DCZ91_18360 [Lachnospiraceae bacterium]|nr:hypothetical protein [Lachnospiraceae bacterium]
MKYNVFIYPCSGETGQPSSEVRMEIDGGFRLFYEDVMGMISMFHEHAKSTGSGADARFRIRDGENGEEFDVCFDEADIIYSLLYCCEGHPDVTVREILYQNSRYTDVSEVRFWVNELTSYCYGGGSYDIDLFAVNIGFHAKKDGNDTQVYVFGPYFYWYPDYSGEDVRVIDSYPRSHGIVEVQDRQIQYAGMYHYDREKVGDTIIGGNGEPEYVMQEEHEGAGAEVFLESDGKRVMFSILLDGKLYRKISMDGEKVIFYSALLDGIPLKERHFESRYHYYASDPEDEDHVVRFQSDPKEQLALSFWECVDGEDVVFEKGDDGEYRYAGENKEVAEIWSGISFVPPQTPDPGSLNQTSAHRLCEDYVKRFFNNRKNAEQPEDEEAAGQSEDEEAAGQPQDEEAAGQTGTERDFKAITAMKKRLLVRLKEEVMGQDLAVEKFVNGYIRHRILGRIPGKPAGLFLFAGPPGTGKTYLAETFVKLMADEGYEYKRFDMAAYGANREDAAGLVGFEKTYTRSQPGQLTDFVKRNPKCVLLFDEIEKACTEVRRLFLSILEGAAIEDKYYDSMVSFEEAILIFTTNEGKDLYEDNRGKNLTALPDSAVREGLETSDFAPELISRFMSGTIIMFNHLTYPNLLNIFRDCMETTVRQIKRDDLKFEFAYDGNLPKLYLLSKGDRIDARFVSTNARQMTLDYFMDMAEKYPGEWKDIQKVTVSVDVTDENREYFELTDRPRILAYGKDCPEVFIGVIEQLRKGFLPENGPETLGRIADAVWEECGEGFRKRLEECNWNSHSKEEKYDAIMINLSEAPAKDDDPEGYACLKAAVELKRDIPVIIVGGKTAEERSPLLSLGATDFVQGCRLWSKDGGGNREKGSLALDRGELEEIFARQHFVEMARGLARKGERFSAEPMLEYKKESGELYLRFTNLHITEAMEEDAEARRQNRKYLLAEKPQVRLKDIFGNALVKEAVERCIDNIRNPGKYRNAGAKLMKGILMYGAPGMGKTMFAKAMASEANAEFISRVGADFLNGDGVDEMEKVFLTARRKRPCILFIDEFDAISRNRGGSITSRQESVLEKFLKEMDGLETDNEGVYVVAATNYPLERLDDAVLRRFSARIPFRYPDMEERLNFLLHVLEKKNLQDKISPRAARTLSLNMYGTRRNYSEIETFVEESVADALYKNEPVTERFLLNRVHNEADGAARKRNNPREYIATAFHEAGHAVLQYHYGMGIDYVTIVSRGLYGGYALGQSGYHAGQDFLDHICVYFAGRIAEMLYTGKEMGINIGAGSDLQNATYVAYEYVCRYAMNNRIMVVPEMFAPQTGVYPESVLPESEKEAIWTSVNQILNQQWNVAMQHLRKCWDEVEALAYSLIYMQELVGEKAEEVIRDKVPHVEEVCFLDSDNDYMRTITDGTGIMVPFGYAVYPYYPYSQVRTQPEEDMPETASRHYYYAVKKAEKSLGISENLQEAFTAAYKQGANCRRFVSQEAAQRYLDMLELKVFRQGENRFCNLYVDALSEMIDSRAAVKDLIILREGEIGWYQVKTDGAGITRLAMLRREYTDWYQEKAAETGMPFSLYLIEELAEKFLEKYESAYRVIQIYDQTLQRELLYYMDAMEQQARRYRRNLGYKD